MGSREQSASEACIAATSGGGPGAGDDKNMTEDGPTATQQVVLEVFPILKGNFGQVEMRAMLGFAFRKRSSPLAQELLSWASCMATKLESALAPE